jgi:hypothetical protein
MSVIPERFHLVTELRGFWRIVTDGLAACVISMALLSALGLSIDLRNLLHRYLTNQLDVIMQICATGATGPSNCENATKFNRSIFGGDSAVDI